MAIVVAQIAVLVVAIGGAAGLWSHAVVFAAAGLLLLVAPPRRSLGLWANLICLLLLALAASAWLPADWFARPFWRSAMLERFGTPLPPSRTPQPWLTAEATCYLIASMAWAYSLFARRWGRADREQAMRIFSAGIVVLGGIALAAYFIGYKIPVWPRVVNLPADFGFFASRNQTANVLGLSGILVMAVACEDLRRKRKRSALWFAGLVIIGAGLVINFSRAGILLFFGGCGLWAVVTLCYTRSKVSLAVAASILTLLLTAFLVFGGDTLKRVQAVIEKPTQDFRIPIQTDALHLSMQAPWFGSGMGNFEALFRFARDKSLQQDYALHPDSDWLWLAVELGWIGVAAVVAAVLLWLRRCLPFSTREGTGLQIAATIYGAGFAAAGLVDVSGHRLGTLWAALFVMSTAIHSRHAGTVRPWVAPSFRVLGLVLIAIAGCWLSPSMGFDAFPNSVTLARLQNETETAFAKADLDSVTEKATAALRIAPLEWGAYAQRAAAEANLGKTEAAIRNFRIARFLQPYFFDSCEYEGHLWLDLGHMQYATEAWKEALRRAPDGGHYSFRQMLTASASAPDVRAQLRAWADENPDYQLALLESAGIAEFKTEIEKLIAQDPELKIFNREQRKSLFQTWSQKDGAARLNQVLLANPQWQLEEWSRMARYYAQEKNFRRAYETVSKFALRPALPKIEPRGKRDTLERDFLLHSDDLMAGLSLYGMQVSEGNVDEAIKTLGTLKRVPSHPKYLSFMEAELHARKQDWESAWTAWEEYMAGNDG